ncbi:tRNA uridine-5-carboxymethylaminomethyl(34) synthesis GTPase MnmE [Taibaiella lutea]|uniref:tRNA modification GTPase MnmE n=1 Tax=Taibaiella lutea TaxID=2608001 RepID=A0A5M6CHC4_9BACT|nr:tRNA uridine-5-carboxymethylaminomethyl(34) synthesis GTPase MnmE [Taibaiella lutea]KAA5534564.1 tRNA uridine-5-carboxymethylaminomethyl(34) synthesis GTPase MnmE [Taibaiella lutea]
MIPNEQTIAAIATAAGVGAIGVIRLSGPEAIAITDAIFKGKNLAAQPSHTIHFGKIVSPKDDSIIDEVVVSIFKGNRSYTGEETVEISGHGSPYVLQQILNACIESGARPAMAGEFTQRAFLNGKMDLSQAEAVADLIAADSKAAHELALNQMRGGFSSELSRLREDLITFAALIELELDFAEEDVEFADRTQFFNTLERLETVIQQLIDSFQYGNVIKEGVPVAIAGKPNAGKSSLLNALFNEEKAIVSEIAGTTRDSIEDVLFINGYKFRFIDTAGLRETTDTIEAIGVERAKAKVAQAKILLYLYDENDTTVEEVLKDLKSFYREELIIILIENKVDLHDYTKPRKNIQADDAIMPYLMGAMRMSTKDAEYINLLKMMLTAQVENLPHENQAIVNNTRHLASLKSTLKHIKEIQQGMAMNLSGDLLAQDIRLALYHLGSITGQVDVDRDILGTIFGKFCIGK